MPPEERIDGPRYRVTPEEIEAFRADGYVHLRGVMTEDEMAGIEAVVDRFLRREIEVPGKDFCDMAGDYGRAPEDYSIVNVMLPRRYFPEWQGNVYELRAASIAEQLQGPGMVIDYDQILAKQPHKADAVFGWHQDMAYWIDTPDTRTATCWLAIDDSTVANGCMRFVPGSGHEPELRPHHALHSDRSVSHTLVTDLDPAADTIRYAELTRGDITVHDARVCHGSGGNTTGGTRRAYVLAFRARETVAEERRRGFTHSHEDSPEVLGEVGVEGETRG